MVSPTSADDTKQDYAYFENALNFTGLWQQFFVNHNGDWMAWQGSIPYLFSDPMFPPNRVNLISFPLFPDSVSGSMAEAATGAYNTQWQQMATNLVNSGYTGLVYRLAPEFNGDWFSDSYGKDTNQPDYPTNFQAAWTQAVNTILNIDPTARFCFNPNGTPTTLADWTVCFPPQINGKYPVDCIGLDFYDFPNISGAINPTNRFKADILPGITKAANFANALGQQSGQWIPLCVPEFGTGACGDNPTFFDQVAASFTGNFLAFFCYWNQGVGSAYNGDLNNSQPWAKQSFIANFRRG